MSETEMQGISFKVLSTGTKKTAEDLSKLASALASIKGALAKLDSKTISKISQLSTSVQNLNGVRISSTIAKQITAINTAISGVSDANITKLQSLTEALSGLNTRSGSGLSATVSAVKDAAKLAVETSSPMDSAQGHLESAYFDADAPDQNALSKADLSGIASKAVTALKILNPVLQVTRGILIKVGSAARNVARDIGSRLVDRLTAGMKAWDRFVASIGRIALYRLIRSALKNVSEALNEGIGNLYQWSLLADGTFAASMDRIATSALYLKNSFGAMVSPLLNALAPAIDFVIDKLVSLINVINQVFALLTGAGTWNKAIKYQTQYAAAADGAGSAAEEFKRQLMGFDEINRLNDQNSGGSGGANALDYSQMFTKEPLSQKIKDALASDNWTSIGQMIAQKANGVVRQIDNWFTGTMEPFLNSWALKIGTLINGFVTDFKWDNLGKMVADGINGVIRPFNTFLTTVNWTAIGNSLASSVHGLFENIDWPSIGEFIANKLNVIVDKFYGFVENFKNYAYMYGTDIGTAINSMFANIRWDHITTDLTDGIKSVTDLIRGINDKIDWNAIKVDISTSLNNAIRNLDLAGLASACSDLAVNIIDVLGTLDWFSLGEQVGHFIANIDWSTISSKVLKIVGKFFAGAIKGLFSSGDGVLFAAIKWGIPLLGSAVSGGISLLKPVINQAIMGAASEGGATAVAGIAAESLPILGQVGLIAAGIVGIVVGINKDIKTYHKTKKAMEERSEAETREWAAAEQLQAALAAKGFEVSTGDIVSYLNGMNPSFQETIDAAMHMSNSVSDSMSDMAVDSNTALTMIKNNAHERMTSMQTDVTASADTMKTHVSQSFDSMNGNTTRAMGLMQSTMRGSTQSILNDTTKKAADTGSGYASGISNSLGQLQSATNSLASRGFNALKSIANSAWNWGADVINNMVSGINSMAYKIRNAVSGVARTVSSYIHFSEPDIGPLSDFHKWMPDMMGQMAEGIHSNEYKVKDAVSDLSEMMASTLSPNVTVGAYTPGTLDTSAGNASRYKSNNADLLAGISSGIASAIGSSGNDENTVINVNVDGDNLFRIMVRKNNQEVARTGNSPLIV